MPFYSNFPQGAVIIKTAVVFTPIRIYNRNGTMCYQRSRNDLTSHDTAQWIRSENKCHFCIKLKFFNFFTIQLRELKFLPMNVLMSTSIFRKLQLSSLYSLIIILFSKIKRCNFLSGQFLSVWFRGIKIMKSMLSYFVQ